MIRQPIVTGAIRAPVLIATTTEMRETAKDLAVRIEAGLFDALDQGMKCDLRALTIQMIGWADDLEDGQ